MIGYSFPDSDTHMRYFVSTALVGNVTLEKIDIIDPDAESIDKRLHEADFGQSFKDLLNPIDKNWESSNYRIVPKEKP